jgi:hypothetical protein
MYPGTTAAPDSTTQAQNQSIPDFVRGYKKIHFITSLEFKYYNFFVKMILIYTYKYGFLIAPFILALLNIPTSDK